MASTTLEINVVSARDLNEVNLVSKMSPYVVVSLAGEYLQKLRTNADRDGGRNPNWNFPMKFTINHLPPRPETLVFTIRTERALGDRDVGEVHVAVPDLVHSAGAGDFMARSYPVLKPSGKTQGVLNFQYKVCEIAGGPSPASKDEKPAAEHVYPPPQPVAGGGAWSQAAPQYYPPAPAYTHPPAQAYSYPTAYGYPPAASVPPKSKKMGKAFGLGAGLLTGMIGGLLLGDLAADFGSESSFSDSSGGSSYALCDASMQASSDSIDRLGTIG